MIVERLFESELIFKQVFPKQILDKDCEAKRKFMTGFIRTYTEKRPSI
jgi:hypothetical protein